MLMVDKKARVAILMSDNLDFKIKTVVRDEEGHYTIIKGSIHQEELTIVNVYAPNVEEAKYINQLITNINKCIDNNTMIVGDFNTLQEVFRGFLLDDFGQL